MSKHFEAKKKHHYVWADYLARWGNGTRNVFYTTPKRKIAIDSVRGIACEYYFYELSELSEFHIQVIENLSSLSPDFLRDMHKSSLRDFTRMQKLGGICRASGLADEKIERLIFAQNCNALEDIHGLYERHARPILAALSEKRLEVLQDEQSMLSFLSFLGFQITRTKSFKSTLVKSFAISPEIEAAIDHAWWFIGYMFGVNVGFSLYANRKTATHSLLVNNTTMPFITSDKPVTNVHPCASEKSTAPESADFYFPISPSIAYIICDSKRFQSGLCEVDSDVVLEFNKKVAMNAMTHIIGNSEGALLPFKKYIRHC